MRNTWFMLPDDLLRDLAHVLGATPPLDLRPFEPSEVPVVRAQCDRLAADFEAGASEIASHALWCSEWYPVARSSTSMYAYAPHACFHGPPGQIICFDTDGGDHWEGYPSVAFWLGALKTAGEGVRSWAAARSRLFRVDLPAARDEQRRKTRFTQPPRTYPVFLDAEIEHRDFTLLVLHALSFGRKPNEVLDEIARALDAEVPHCNLHTLSRAGLDDAVELGRSWLTPLFSKHAAKKNVTQLAFGAEHASGGLRLWMWPGAPGYTPNTSERSVSSTPCFAELSSIIASPDVGHSREAWTFVSASAAFLVHALLEATARSLPWEGELSVMLDQKQLGIVDIDGFVPTPLSIARTHLAASREGTATGLSKMGFPGRPPTVIDHPVPPSSDTRRLRHPDGRVTEVVVNADSWRCTMTESDGECDTFTRALKTGWEAETFIAAQLRDGFVDV